MCQLCYKQQKQHSCCFRHLFSLYCISVANFVCNFSCMKKKKCNRLVKKCVFETKISGLRLYVNISEINYSINIYTYLWQLLLLTCCFWLLKWITEYSESHIGVWTFFVDFVALYILTWSMMESRVLSNRKPRPLTRYSPSATMWLSSSSSSRASALWATALHSWCTSVRNSLASVLLAPLMSELQQNRNHHRTAAQSINQPHICTHSKIYEVVLHIRKVKAIRCHLWLDVQFLISYCKWNEKVVESYIKLADN